MIAKLTTLFTMLAALSLRAGDFDFVWDANTDTVTKGYFFYASTNSITAAAPAPTNATVRINVGTNVQWSVIDLSNGLWSFAVTAYNASGKESDTSNVYMHESRTPQVPKGFRTVSGAIQYSGVITNGFVDVGFLKLKIISVDPPIPKTPGTQ